MTEIVLIRPGCTDYDDQERIQGALDVPLNERGRAEVERLAGELSGLGIEAVFAAGGQPSMATAEAIAAGLNVRFKKVDRLRNLNLGLWQGMPVDEVRKKQPKVYRQWQETPECICPPEGEMLGDAEDRVRAVLSRLVKRNRDAVVGVIVPEPLASLVAGVLVERELGDLWKALRKHGQWEVFKVQHTVGAVVN